MKSTDGRAVIFDHDGVMVDSEPLHRIAWRRVFEPRGYILKEEDLFVCIGMRDRYFADYMVKKYAITIDVLEILRAKSDEMIKLLATETEMIAGLDKLLFAIAKDRPVGIASSASRREIDTTLRRFGIEGVFSTIVCHDNTTQFKPHPEPYMRATRELGAHPARTIAFEDSHAGMQSAHGAGLRIIGITTSFTREQLPLADVLVKDFSDTDGILAMLDELAPPQ